MKKLSYLLMMACIVVAATFTSCSKDNEEKNADVVGTWKISKLLTNGKDVTPMIKAIPNSDEMLAITATFGTDGKLTLAPPAKEGEKDHSIVVNYALEGNEIVLSLPADELAANNDMMVYYNMLKLQGFKITVDGNIIHCGMADFNLKVMVDGATKDMDDAEKTAMNMMLVQMFGNDLTKVSVDLQLTK